MTHLLKAAKAALLVALLCMATGLLSAQSQSQCYTHQLRGAYAYTFAGTIIGMGSLVGVSTATFDGAGKVTLSGGAESLNGTIIKLGTVPGTYKVNLDCTGTATLDLAPGFVAHLDFVIADNGKTIYGIESDTGVALSVTFTKM